jgi:hypothetical protein
MTLAQSWTGFIALFDKDALNLLSSFGSFGAALCAVAAAALSRQQHFDSLAGAPTVETPNHAPRAQLSFTGRFWDGMAPGDITVRNIGSGAMLQAQLVASVRPCDAQLADLPPQELLSVGPDAFAVRPDQRALSRLKNGVEQEVIPLLVEARSELFELAPGTTFKFLIPVGIYAWCLAHAALSAQARLEGRPSAILDLTIRYRTAGAKRRQRRFAIALTPRDLGPAPLEAPTVFGANFELQLIEAA